MSIAPSVTIGIITRDRPAYLADAVESALAQDSPADEILIVVDGPNTATEQVLAAFGNRIRTIVIPPSGRPRARNKAVQEFQSDYLLWLDDDDVLAVHAISSMKAVAQQDPLAGIVYSNLIVCNEKLEFVSEDKKKPLLPRSILHTFFTTVPVANGGTMIHRRCFDSVGLYDEFYSRGQDYDFFARAASAEAKFVHNNNYFYLYRSHGGSTAARENLEKFSHFRVAVMRSLLQRHSIDQIFSHLPWQANQQLAILQAAQDAAINLTRYRGYEEAAQVLSAAATGHFKELVEFLVSLIRTLQTKDLDALTKFTGDRLFYTQMAQQLLDAHLPNVADAEQQDKWREAYLEQRFALCPIEQVFATYNWQEKPEESFRVACVAAAGQFIGCGSIGCAIEVIDQLGTLDPDEIAPFLKNCAQRYDRGGMQAVHTLRDCPEYYHRLTQQLLSSFGAREIELSERDQERRLLGRKAAQATNSVHIKSSAAYIDEINSRASIESRGQLQAIKPILEEAAETLANSTSPTSVGNLAGERQFSVTLPRTKTSHDTEISVVIPTVNRPQLLIEAATSAAVFHNLPVEVLIVNDAGPELEADIISALSSLPLPLTILRHSKNLGLAAARNTGISHSRGRWVLFLDDDDILLSGGLESLFKESHSRRADIVAGDHIRQHIRREHPYREEFHPGCEDVEQALSIDNSNFVSGSFLIKRELLTQVGGYREDLPVQEDYNLNIRASAAGRVKCISAPVFAYRIREDADRMNTSRRLTWFGTSALNHEVYRSLIGCSELTAQRQRANQYEHIAQAVYEGLDEKIACEAISAWWSALAKRSLAEDLALDQAILNMRMPSLARLALRLHSSRATAVGFA